MKKRKISKKVISIPTIITTTTLIIFAYIIGIYSTQISQNKKDNYTSQNVYEDERVYDRFYYDGIPISIVTVKNIQQNNYSIALSNLSSTNNEYVVIISQDYFGGLSDIIVSDNAVKEENLNFLVRYAGGDSQLEMIYSVDLLINRQEGDYSNPNISLKDYTTITLNDYFESVYSKSYFEPLAWVDNQTILVNQKYNSNDYTGISENLYLFNIKTNKKQLIHTNYKELK